MSMDRTSKLIFWRFVLFGLFGLLLEVFFTAIAGLIKRDITLQGHSSLWMMLDYGLIGLLYPPVQGLLLKMHMVRFLRAAMYMCLIFLVEYLSGRLFASFGLRLWDYSNYSYNLDGYITLWYAPLWYLLGYSLEWLFPKFDRMAGCL